MVVLLYAWLDEKAVYQKDVENTKAKRSAESLVNWLNTTTDPEAKERVSNIVQLFLDLYAYSSKELVTPTASVPKAPGAAEIFGKKHDLLNDALSRYQLVPGIQFSLPPDGRASGLRVHIHWEAAPGSKLRKDMRRRQLAQKNQKPVSANHSNLPGAQLVEIGAFNNALNLIDSGLIFKIQRCRCEEFFFQRFSHQRFCSEKCRIAEFRTGDEARVRRNAYARKLYHLHKTQNVK